MRKGKLLTISDDGTELVPLVEDGAELVPLTGAIEPPPEPETSISISYPPIQPPVAPVPAPLPPNMPVVTLTVADLARLENQMPGVTDKLVALGALARGDAARLT